MKFSKQLLTSLLISMSLILTSQILFPKKASAVLFFSGQDFTAIRTVPAGIVCIVFLPLCILDEKTSVTAMTREDGSQSGLYTEAELEQILADQAELIQNLTDQGKSLKVTAHDNRETIMEQIRSIYPQVSDLYLNFITDQLGLN